VAATCRVTFLCLDLILAASGSPQAYWRHPGRSDDTPGKPRQHL